jgi:hypothetical protein
VLQGNFIQHLRQGPRAAARRANRDIEQSLICGRYRGDGLASVRLELLQLLNPLGTATGRERIVS